MNNDMTELTLSDIFRIFKRRFLWFAVVFLGVCFATLIYLLFFTKPIYEASAQLLVQTSQPTISIPSAVTQLIGVSGLGSLGGGADVATEIELMKTRQNIEKLIEQLNLMELFKGKKQVLVEDVVKTVGEKWLKIENVKNTKIIQVTAEHQDPEIAAKVVNSLVDIYLDLRSRLTVNEYSARVDFIERQLPRIEQELKDVEDKLRKFKEENQVYSLSDQAAKLVEGIAQFDAKVYEAKVSIEQTKTGIKAAEDMLKKVDQKIISSETISTNPVVQQLRSKLVDLQVELSALLQTYSETDRRVISLKKQIEETQDLLQKEISKVISAEIQTINPAYSELYTTWILKQTELQVQQATLSAVEKIRDEYLKKVSTVPAIEQKLFELERERQAKQATYLALLSQYEQVKIGAAGTVDTVRVISSAVVPNRPSKPNKKLILAIGGVLGIFLGILAVFIREATDKKFKAVDELQRIFPKAPILGTLSNSRNKKSEEFLVTFECEKQKICDDFKQLAATVLDEPTKILGVTSSDEKEGKTFVASNLAYVLSKMGQKTLLIDMNVRSPMLSKVFSLDNNADITDLVKGLPLEDCVAKFSDNLDILPLNEEDSWLLTNPKLVDHVGKVVQSYDKIIVDMPPLNCAEGILASKVVEKFVMVVCLGRTEKNLVISLMNSSITGKSVGIIVNRTNQ
ncbi:MAG: polysaccharide biosynthesis tyrosine autokinase [Pseudothermotoga sp.]